MKQEFVHGFVQIVFAAVIAGIAWAAASAANWDLDEKIILAIFAYLAPSPLQRGTQVQPTVEPQKEGEVK